MNNNTSSKASAGGVSVVTVIGIVFVILKLLKIIDWPWIWVLCPFWAPVVLVIGIFGIVSIIVVIRGNKL